MKSEVDQELETDQALDRELEMELDADGDLYPERVTEILNIYITDHCHACPVTSDRIDIIPGVLCLHQGLPAVDPARVTSSPGVVASNATPSSPRSGSRRQA
jgi:hypothetical protein